MTGRPTLNELKRGVEITALARYLGVEVKGRQGRCYNYDSHKDNDRHFSLGFDPKTNRYKCFACQESGSVIDLYMKVRGVAQGEAIRALSELAGKPLAGAQGGARVRFNPIIKQTAPRPVSPESIAIYEALAGFCNGCDEETAGYLKGPSRGLTDDTIKRFKIFSVKDYQGANKFLQGRFNSMALRESGLINDQGNLIFYKHKVIVPFLKDDRIVFLQGRRLDDEHPKYLHLARPVPLFNLDTLKDLNQGQKIFICEGVFDAMILEQNSHRAIAILGVENFKPAWAEGLKDFEIVLCLDNDQAGKRAVQGIAKVFLSKGVPVKQKQLPQGVKDLSEFYLKAVRV